MSNKNTVDKALTVNTYYSRSVNVERDLVDEEVIRAYIPTTKAKETLTRLVECFNDPNRTSAYSLIGPYGSGKSSFAVFLTQLLAAKNSKLSALAIDVLTAADPVLAKAINGHINAGRYLPIVLSGNPEPLSRRIVEGIRSAALSCQSSEQLIERIDTLRKQDYTHEDIKTLIESLQQLWFAEGGQGLLIVLDEFGKFLEYDARHSNSEDIHLLQIIAEATKGSAQGRILFFVLLHQAFDQYAKGMSDALKKEWSKIQGRFETIPFLESTEQTLQVLANSFHYKQTAKERASRRLTIDKAAELFLDAKMLQTSMDTAHLADLLERCYPLHPITALLLPQLCQKVAQNERTLFSFIGSHEPFGFRELVQSSNNDFVGLSGIYDYFIANQSGAITDSLTQKRWYEVLSAVERLGDAEPVVIQLLKTIGLMNIIGARGGFKASTELLTLLFAEYFDDAVQVLLRKSLIVFRQYSQEFAVWQGSDFDLDAAVTKAKNEIGQFSLADRLNQQSPLEPLIARKYSFENACIRYFKPVFADISNYKKLLNAEFEPRLVVFLLTGAEDQKAVEPIVKEFIKAKRITDILLFYPNASVLADAVVEVLALKHAQQHEQLLKEDRVALREFSDRLYSAENHQRIVLSQILSDTQGSQFFSAALAKKQNELGASNVRNRRSIQMLLSHVLEAVYPASPIIRNELINRESPSAQANLGKKNLLLALLEHSSEECFGIDKFPPEKGMYLAIYKESGLHKQTENGFALNEPTELYDKTNLGPVWQKIKLFFESTKDSAKGFDELDRELMLPPFGVKPGVLSILYVTAIMLFQDKLALFQEGVYQPSGLTPMRLQIFLKSHKYFKVQLFSQANVQERFIESLALRLGLDANKTTILDIASQIMGPILNAQAYTQGTDTLSDAAKKLRQAVKSAATPHKVILEVIPEIFAIDANNHNSVMDGIEALMQVVKEIQRAYTKMLQHFAVTLGQTFSIGRDDTVDLRSYVLQIKGHLFGFSDKFDGLLAEGSDELLLINAIKHKEDITDPVDWLVEILTVLGRISPEKWTDRDVALLEKKLRKIHSSFADALELLEQDKLSKKQKNLFFVKSLSSEHPIRRQAVAIDDKQLVQADQLVGELLSVVNKTNLDEAVLTAALSKLIGKMVHE